MRVSVAKDLPKLPTFQKYPQKLYMSCSCTHGIGQGFTAIETAPYGLAKTDPWMVMGACTNPFWVFFLSTIFELPQIETQVQGQQELTGPIVITATTSGKYKVNTAIQQPDIMVSIF